MVKVEEVKDASFEDEENDSDYETSSSVGSDDDDAISIASSAPDEAETLSDRLYALKDMIPPTTRLSISNKLSYTASWVKWSANSAGNVAWVLTTTALMIGLPYALAVEGEAALQAQEKEIYSKEQGQQALMGAPAGAQPTSLTPPGF
ncbi:putative mitochondrial import receptor subunit tom22 [Mrakia frigida]|uniref:Tom22p n=1 Tax=Mrakia frigida TaxID=29902 RepID=UPI003FCC0F5C